jgi:hypothetical protein
MEILNKGRNVIKEAGAGNSQFEFLKRNQDLQASSSSLPSRNLKNVQEHEFSNLNQN